MPTARGRFGRSTVLWGLPTVEQISAHGPNRNQEPGLNCHFPAAARPERSSVTKFLHSDSCFRAAIQVFPRLIRQSDAEILRTRFHITQRRGRSAGAGTTQGKDRETE